MATAFAYSLNSFDINNHDGCSEDKTPSLYVIMYIVKSFPFVQLEEDEIDEDLDTSNYCVSTVEHAFDHSEADFVLYPVSEIPNLQSTFVEKCIEQGFPKDFMSRVLTTELKKDFLLMESATNVHELLRQYTRVLQTDYNLSERCSKTKVIVFMFPACEVLFNS